MNNYQFEHLAERKGFNRIVRHCKSLIGALGDVGDDYNLADILNDEIEGKSIEEKQLLSLVNTILVDKYGYLYKSVNIPESIDNFQPLIEASRSWNAVDIVLVYHHPELGIKVINPARSEQFSEIALLKKHELITIYSGGCGKTDDMLKNKASRKQIETALDLIVDFLGGQKIKVVSSLTKGPFVTDEDEEEQEEAPMDAPETKEVVNEPVESVSKTMVGPYGVPVSNELFHNGNVEAWKKIIESYTTKYPDTDVYIFYDGERIHDINTLFKWGKVKHGSSIFFSAAGTNIKDLAKLKRYLAQGASPRFEDFLRFSAGKILNLF